MRRRQGPGHPAMAQRPHTEAGGRRRPPDHHPGDPVRWTPDRIGDLAGTTALVTGANSGIGYVEALELARHGADVVLAVRNTDAGDAAAERIRGADVRGT